MLSLLQQRPVWTGPELAERLGVTTRSIRRDVERLRGLGYPVLATQGLGGGYQLGRGKDLPPLLLDDDEAVAIAVSLRLAAGGTVTGASEAALSTLAKLDQVMPPRLRSEVKAIHQSTETLSTDTDLVDGDVLLTLAKRVPRPAAGPLRVRRPRRRRHRALGRADPARGDGSPVVPHGVGRRPRGLADVPSRPDARRDPVDLAVQAARAPRPRGVRAELDQPGAVQQSRAGARRAPARRGGDEASTPGG